MEESHPLDAPPESPPPPRERRREQAGTLPPALVLIAVGAWAFLAYRSDQPPAPWEVLVLLVAGVGLSMLVRFPLYRCAETGLLFLGSLTGLLVAAGLIVRLALPDASLATIWPLGLVALGLALALTRLLGRVRGLMPAALCCTAAGGVALPFTLGGISENAAAGISAGWPLLAGALGLVALLIVAGQRRPQTTPDESEAEPDEA